MFASAGLCILLYVIGVVAVVNWIAISYPRRIMQSDGLEFMRLFQSVFQRFASHRCYYGLVYTLRSLGIALIPVIFVNEPEAQVMLMAILFVPSVIAQSFHQPWRSTIVNYVDATMVGVLVLVLSGGARFSRGQLGAEGYRHSCTVQRSCSISACFQKLLPHLMWLPICPTAVASSRYSCLILLLFEFDMCVTCSLLRCGGLLEMSF